MTRAAASRAVAAAFPAAVAAAAASANGGYFPTSWGAEAVALGWAVAVALVVGRRLPLRRLELAAPAALVLLVLWTAASAAWGSTDEAFSESERTLVQLAGVGAFLVLVRRRGLYVAAGALAAATTAVCTYALATRLFPDRLGALDRVAGYRLSAPVGYWNGLGIYAAIGIAVALCVAARGRTLARALGGAAVPLLAATLYFTFSRGAAVALLCGLAAGLALDPRRLQLLATAVGIGAPAAAGVLVASRSPALTRLTAAAGRAAHEGHRLAALLAGLALLAAAVALAVERLERMVTPTRRVRVALTAALAVAAAGAAAAGLAAAGGPGGLVRRFEAPPRVTNGNLNARLFSFSGTYRASLWAEARDEWRAHPLLGGGAGSYERWWLAHRPRAQKVRDAHSLYLETLAELGPVGLALLLAALAPPLVAAWRARRHPLAAGLAAAYVAYLVHAAVDWDWELTAVTLTALLCGAALLVAARSDEEESREPARGIRYGALGVTAAFVAAAFVALVASAALSRSAAAARRGDWRESARAARRAHAWAPWSADPWRALGEAQLGLGETAPASASFRHAIAASPGEATLWFDLARASTGRAQAAALAHARRLDPLGPEIAELEHELRAQGRISVVGG